ncbi:MAG: glycosyltransferase [Selenomonas ruminantium]|uniref:Glycosyltransferase n=1 Tax=Selenomonas ruminantium TaxID=971 RepID=A0A927ZRS0_SELRU|nr:glycosyltransferase [Selenomonas ruminantium]
MKKIIWISNINPQKTNYGTPSGLPWEIIGELKKNNQVDLYIMNNATNKIVLFMNRIGIFFFNCKLNLSLYDVIVVYPNVIANVIPKKYRNKVISIGPDSSSLLFSRLLENSFGVKRFKYCLYEKIFAFLEKKWLGELKKIIVVGREDKKVIAARGFSMNNVFYFHHPLLHNDLLDLDNYKITMCNKKRFVFSGDLSNYYVGDYIDKLIRILYCKKCFFIDILVVGQKNKWAYYKMKDYDLNVAYMAWIDDYKDICHPESDIHCIPLKAGAGTKNRVLTAIANGLEIITTPIGIENILIDDLSDVYVVKDYNEFADRMIELHNKKYCLLEIKKRIEKRAEFRRKIDENFRKDVAELIQ